jgi:NADP-dependent 3-hydroxy acid dehydrogenase YdfG
MDKVVLITGASSGIGAGIARELSACARVMLGARREDRLAALAAEIAQAGGEARTRRLDVTRRADMESFAEAARAAWGRVDVIFNNAGVMPLSPMASMKVEEWDRMVDVNIKGVLHGIAAVLPEMTARGSGHVVDVASVGALTVSPMAAVYCATKFAVRAISDGLGQESPRIRATCIHPGRSRASLRAKHHGPAARRGDDGLPRHRAQARRDRARGAVRPGAARRRGRERDRRAAHCGRALRRAARPGGRIGAVGSKRWNASAQSGCQRDRAGRFSVRSPAAQAMRRRSVCQSTSLSWQMT